MKTLLLICIFGVISLQTRSEWRELNWTKLNWFEFLFWVLTKRCCKTYSIDTMKPVFKKKKTIQTEMQTSLLNFTD